MKAISLHLTFRMVVLEKLCSLSQLEEKDSNLKYTGTQNPGEGEGGGWQQRGHRPPQPACQEGGGHLHEVTAVTRMQ